MTFLYALVLLGALVFVHELGHFLFAKSLGVKVLKFSLGFGPKLIGRSFGDTEYLISAVPLGGYVKMLGQSDVPEEEEEIPEAEKHRAYNFQPVWKRFAIIVSGPLFNLIFAALIFVFIFISGVPVTYPDVGKVTADSPAFKAGFMTGDKVIEINGDRILSWDEIDVAVSESAGRTMKFRVKRGEELRDLSVMPEKKTVQNLFGESKDGWDIGVTPLIYPIVGDVNKGSRAEEAGLKKGDIISEIEGTALRTWQDMTAIIHGNPEKPLRFRIQRNSEMHELIITPEKKTFKTPDRKDTEIGLIGISPRANDFIKKFGLPGAISGGFSKTWDISVLTLVSMVKLIQRIIPADTIGGPILIFQMAGQQASQGAMSFFTFMAVISINLGILNLLPIPVLDGGHLMFLGIEAVRRKPLSERIIMVAQKVGLVLLVMLMVFALYNDIGRLIAGKMF
jgi:regulator of sigma E protease